MKATFALIGDTNTENYGRKCMVKANNIANIGFEMARLPFHISLKQPFKIPSLETVESIFDEYVSSAKAITVPLLKLDCFSSNALGYESGCMSIRAENTSELKVMQENLFELLEAKLGSCPAEHNWDYVFHMTIAIGGAPYKGHTCL